MLREYVLPTPDQPGNQTANLVVIPCGSLRAGTANWQLLSQISHPTRCQADTSWMRCLRACLYGWWISLMPKT
eukprot:scaffold64790_cov15-Tisochrysis_lutea.AAC.1